MQVAYVPWCSLRVLLQFADEEGDLAELFDAFYFGVSSSAARDTWKHPALPERLEDARLLMDEGDGPNTENLAQLLRSFAGEYNRTEYKRISSVRAGILSLSLSP